MSFVRANERYCIGFALLRFVIGPNNSCYSLNQSDAKLKPTLTWSFAFSRALDSLAVFTLSSHWLSKIFCFLLIGRCDFFGFGFMTLNRKALHTKCELFANIPVCSSSWWQQCCNYITLEVLSFEKENKVNQTQVRY